MKIYQNSGNDIQYEKNLPNYILNKDKTGWSVPLTVWLSQFEIIKKITILY